MITPGTPPSNIHDRMRYETCLRHDLDWNHDQLDDRCIGQGSTHRYLYRHVKK